MFGSYGAVQSMDDWRLKISNKGIIPVLMLLYTNLITSNPHLITLCFCYAALYCWGGEPFFTGSWYRWMHKIDEASVTSSIFSPEGKYKVSWQQIDEIDTQSCSLCYLCFLFSPTYLKQALRADKLPPEQLATWLNAHWESVVRGGFVSESALRMSSAQSQWGWVLV